MTGAPDPKTVREIARKFLLDAHMTHSEFKASIRDHIGRDATDETFSAWYDAVRADIRKGSVETIASWPDEQPKLRPEYGIRVVYTSTRMREEAISDNADDAREQAAKTAENRNVVSAVPIRRPVGDWEELSTDV